MDEALYQAVPPAAKRAWRQLTPSGLADMSFHFQSNTPAKLGKVDYQLVLEPKEMQINYALFPYPFRGVTGQVVVTPGIVELTDVSASEGGMRTSLKGKVHSTDEGDWADLSVGAVNVPIDKRLLSALPDELLPLTRRFKPGGTCNLALEQLKFLSGAPPARAGGSGKAGAQPASRPASRPSGGARAVPEKKGAWLVAGDIQLSDAVADFGFGYRKLDGAVAGWATRSAQGLAFDAKIALKSISLGGLKLTGVSGKVVKAAASPIIRVEDLLAKAHGGRVAGMARIKLAEPFQYAVNIYVEDVKLADLFNPGAEDAKKRSDVKGLLDGDIKMTGKAGQAESKRGVGKLRITKARLYKLPVLLGALQVVFLTLPGNSAYTEAFVTYRIRGQHLVFDEIYLTGSALSMVGSGTMNLKNQKIHLTFLTGRPGKLPRISGLADKVLNLAEELLKVFVKNLVQVEVTGTLARPIMRTVPLRSVKDAIRKLTNPDHLPE